MALAAGLRLDLRQTQGLVLTPQLQQAIKLLQLSNLELSAAVDREVAENPFLERAEGLHVNGVDGPGTRTGLQRAGPDRARRGLVAALGRPGRRLHPGPQARDPGPGGR